MPGAHENLQVCKHVQQVATTPAPGGATGEPVRSRDTEGGETW